MSEKQFEIGKIVNTQGIKGDVRCVSFTDDIKRFDLLKSVYVTTGKTTRVLEIERHRYHKQFVVIKFKGVDTMNDAESLKNSIIKIDESEALPLKEDEYYIGDLYGLEVFDKDNNKIGKIKDIIFTGANDVYVIEREDKKDLLLPAIKQCILNVDIEENKMIVEVLKGLDE